MFRALASTCSKEGEVAANGGEDLGELKFVRQHCKALAVAAPNWWRVPCGKAQKN
jgi:hypothetical protein